MTTTATATKTPACPLILDAWGGYSHPCELEVGHAGRCRAGAFSGSGRSATTFRVGHTYSATSACNHNCVWTFEVISRTAKFITIREQSDGETMRVGVRSHDGEEWASPFGTYSMAPVIRAGRS